jgi:hypothetical protein
MTPDFARINQSADVRDVYVPWIEAVRDAYRLSAEVAALDNPTLSAAYTNRAAALDFILTEPKAAVIDNTKREVEKTDGRGSESGHWVAGLTY